jgi:DNA-binding transcriptional MerR regulator/uncharacterized glyoxalase superfamily protein PhnB
VSVGGRTWRVGALARAASLTVRTLHYYDEIGLLSPSRRSEAGHRAYTDDDVDRLFRICALRRLGLPLSDIARALDGGAWTLSAALTVQLEQVDRRLDEHARLRTRLAALLAQNDSQPSDHSEDLLEVLEQMTRADTGVQRRISVLVYADLESAYDYLTRCFGLGPGEQTRDDAGTVVHAEMQAGDGVLWLHRETEEHGLASPRRLGASTGMVAVLVDDVDSHHQHALEQGATIRYAPVDQPYGYREYGALDCEGHLWSFMKPLV